jgi:hypothetical protein
MSPSPTAEDFPFFPHLPPEIRVKIWRLALLAPPRLIPLFHNSFTSSFILVLGLSPRVGHDWSLSSTSTVVPFALKAIPFVCTESHSVFQKSSIMSLEHNITASRTLTTPYNPSLDVVLFSQRVEPGTIRAFVTTFPKQAAKTKRLAISCLKYPVQVLLELKEMSDLEEALIEWHKPSPSAGEDWNDWWADGLEKPYGTRWELQEALTKVIDGFRNKWPDWRVPSVRVIEHWEDILIN